ncbi:MAG TPA: PIG-L family deacetylase, partial [Chloroflexia bacterium]|nr:PIG-L family deacetylase [Chloroflexia bacterium]
MPINFYLSPHFDDVALSIGGLAAARSAAAQAGVCITIFAAPPPAGAPLSAYAQRLHTRWGAPDPSGGNALRRAEDQHAAAILGYDLLLLPYPDAIYRHGRYLSNPDIFGTIHPAEAGFAAELARHVESALA